MYCSTLQYTQLLPTVRYCTVEYSTVFRVNAARIIPMGNEATELHPWIDYDSETEIRYCNIVQ
jgi:hypothetical protein